VATRIAHFSDTHVLAIGNASLNQFLNKRITGAANLILNRARHYRTEVFEAVLDAISSQKADHVVCTGDLVNLALKAEFEKVRELLAKHFEPGALTIVPGNHDYYVKEAMELAHFEEMFRDYLPASEVAEQSYPFLKVLDSVAIIGLCSAVEQPFFFAGGRIGASQLDEMKRLHQDPRVKDKFKIVLVHHPLVPDPERRLEFTRRLEDANAFIETLWSLEGDAPDMVLNGHNHRYRRCYLPGTSVINVQAASASRFGGKYPAEYNIYEIDDGILKSINRHIYDPDSNGFTDVVAYDHRTAVSP
jgi:3',5'-cyclic AMP phosphodiesterase CpdA